MKVLIFVIIVLLQLLECTWLCHADIKSKNYLELQDLIFNYWISIPLVLVPVVLLVVFIQESPLMHIKIYRKGK